MDIKYDLKVRKIEKITREKEDEELEVYRILARDEDGVNQVMLTTPNRPNGVKPGMIITMTLTSPQKTLK